MKPVILTDVDGILISWQSGLPYFAQKYNLPVDHILQMIISEEFIAPKDLFDCDEEFAMQLMEKYNTSDFIRYLSAYSDALCVVNQLKETYDFVAVTALGTSVESKLNRQFNLNALFPGAFKDVFVCGHSAPKTELFQRAKEKYGDRIVCYLDDLGHHIDAAENVFGDSIKLFFMPRGNKGAHPRVHHTHVKDWTFVESFIKPKETKPSNVNWPGITPYNPRTFKRVEEEQVPVNWEELIKRLAPKPYQIIDNHRWTPPIRIGDFPNQNGGIVNRGE